MEVLQYTFFQNALLGALLVSVVCGVVGCYIVVRRLVFISGGITHASFGGLGLGFFLGVSPTIMAMVFAVASALGIEILSDKGKVREDSAIAVMWSLGMALGVLFVFLTPGYAPSMSEFLFGNILSITTADLWTFLLVAIGVVVFFIAKYRTILFLSFDAEFARSQGERVRMWEMLLMVIVAITIVLTIRLVGIVLLMSLLTLPQMIATLFTRRLSSMMILSVLISALGAVAGLLLSVFLNVPSGALIILTLMVMFFLAKTVDKIVIRTRGVKNEIQ